MKTANESKNKVKAFVYQ